MSTEIRNLIEARIAAKRAEDTAAEARKAIDLQIAELFRPAVGSEGIISEKFDGLAKVSVRFGVTRSVDTAALQTTWSDLPVKVQHCFRFKADVVLPNLRALEPDDKATASDFITSKPSTPSVTVELI